MKPFFEIMEVGSDSSADNLRARIQLVRLGIRDRSHSISEALYSFRELLGILNGELGAIKSIWPDIKSQCEESFHFLNEELKMNKELYQTIARELPQEQVDEKSIEEGIENDLR